MQQTLMLLERVRRTLPTKSNYALSKALGITQSDLNRTLAAKNGLSIKALVRVSEITQVPLIDVLAMTQEEIAKTPANKAFWGQRSPRASTTAAVAALAFLVVGRLGHGAPVNTVEILSKNLTTYTLCEQVEGRGLGFKRRMAFIFLT